MLKYIMLGIVQGLTEFLPVSSSGHLVIFQRLFNVTSNQLTLDVFLHFGTVIPIIIIYREDIRDLLLLKPERRRMTWLIILGIIPTGLMGYFFKDFFTSAFSSVLTTGFMLLITGLLLFLAERMKKGERQIKEMRWYNAVIVSIAQGLAILPGISRSGTTISSSLFQGLSREAAARYSFLISIPVILGAGLLELKDVLETGMGTLNWEAVAAGTLAAAISGYLAIKFLLQVLKKGSLIIFSFYCWGLGLLVILIAGLLN